MPYTVRQGAAGCSGYAVLKKETGEMVPGGCHPTKGKAIKHLAALEAATMHEKK